MLTKTTTKITTKTLVMAGLIAMVTGVFAVAVSVRPNRGLFFSNPTTLNPLGSRRSQSTPPTQNVTSCHCWRQITTPASGSPEVSGGMAVDGSGNIYIASHNRVGTAYVAGRLYTQDQPLIKKMNPCGGTVWSTNLSSLFDGFFTTSPGPSIARGPDGSLYLAGNLTDASRASVWSGGRLNSGVWLAKLNPADGSSLWPSLIFFGTSSGSEDVYTPHDIEVDSTTGNVYITGSRSMNNGDPISPYTLGEGFLAAFDSAGTLLWNQAFVTPLHVSGGEDLVVVHGVNAETDGIYIAGSVDLTAVSGCSLVSGVTSAFMTAKYDFSGTRIWEDNRYPVSTGCSGRNIIVAYGIDYDSTSGYLVVGGIAPYPSQVYDKLGMISVYNPNGALAATWKYGFDTLDTDSLVSVSGIRALVAQDRKIYLTGDIGYNPAVGPASGGVGAKKLTIDTSGTVPTISEDWSDVFPGIVSMDIDTHTNGDIYVFGTARVIIPGASSSGLSLRKYTARGPSQCVLSDL